MKLSGRTLESCDVLRVEGDVTAADVVQLKEALQSSLRLGRYCIVLDLEACSYIGSAGFSALLDVSRACRRWKRGDLVLASVPPNLDHLLRVAGLVSDRKSRFPLFASVEEAVAEFKEITDNESG